MLIALILDPLDTLNIKKDTSFAIMQEAAARGHDLFVMQSSDLLLDEHRVLAHAHCLRLTGDPQHWYQLDAAATMDLATFDAVLMRKDPPFDMEYLYSTYLLEQAVAGGARVVNAPQAIRDYNEKLAIERFAAYTAPTRVARRASDLQSFIDLHGDVILKPIDGMGGAGIFRVRADDPNRNVIVETLNRHNRQTVMVQRYIPEIANGDKRILIINGEPFPHALARIPKAGESRGNLAAGGRAEIRPLTARDWEIARAVAPRLKADGLLLVGLDVIGDYLTEVNVTSPTGMQEIFKGCGINPATWLIDAVEGMCANG